jgi:hypothetical protein
VIRKGKRLVLFLLITHHSSLTLFLLASTVTVEARHPKGGWFWQRREFTR